MPQSTIGKNSSAETIAEAGISLDMIFFEVGPVYTEYLDRNAAAETSVFRIKNEITIVSSEIFFFYGVGFSLQFKLDEFIDKVSVFYE